LWKHGFSHNACSAHALPEPAVNVIGSVVGGSVNKDVRPTKLNAVAAEFSPGSTNSFCAEFISGMTGNNGGHSASREALVVKNEQGNGFSVGGCALIKVRPTYAQATMRGADDMNYAQTKVKMTRVFHAERAWRRCL